MGLHLLWEELKWDCIFVGGIKMGFESWAEISSVGAQWTPQCATSDDRFVGNTITNVYKYNLKYVQIQFEIFTNTDT